MSCARARVCLHVCASACAPACVCVHARAFPAGYPVVAHRLEVWRPGSRESALSRALWHTRAHTHTQHAHTHTRTHTRTHAHTHHATYTHTQTHTRTHTHTHTHTVSHTPHPRHARAFAPRPGGTGCSHQTQPHLPLIKGTYARFSGSAFIRAWARGRLGLTARCAQGCFK